MALFKKNTPYFDPYDEYESDANEAVSEEPKAVKEESASAFGGLNIGGSNIELKVVRPEKYSDATQIADHLLCNRTVVLNLENTDKATSHRLIEFLGGVTYALSGGIKKVANDTFIITPNNVSVSESQITSDSEGDEPQPVGFTSDEDEE
jgi:cell division inhibitor SepF